MQNIDGNTYGFCLSVYSRGERNYSPLPSTVHCVVHRWNTDELKPSVCSKGEGNCSPPRHCSICSTPLETPTVCLIPLVYSKGEGNCSPLPGTVHYVVHWWKHRRTQTVSVFQRQGELFHTPDTVHYVVHR